MATAANPPASSAKNYCFTLFGNSDKLDQMKDGLPEDLTYLIWQVEKCPETGRIHRQGYVQFARKCRGIKKLQDLIGPCNVSVARGSLEQNRAYCTKEASRTEGPWEVGTPKTAGQRSDLASFRDAIKSGKSEKRLLEDHPNEFFKYYRSIPYIRSLTREVMPPKYKLTDYNHEPVDLSIAWLFVGKSGMGKTHFALAHFKNPLLVTHLDQLGHLTSDHDGIVIDDLDFRHCPFPQIVNLLDMETDRHVHIRYQTALIPAGTKRIFTSNRDDIFFPPNLNEEQTHGINRRHERLLIDNILFSRPNN